MRRQQQTGDLSVFLYAGQIYRRTGKAVSGFPSGKSIGAGRQADADRVPGRAWRGRRFLGGQVCETFPFHQFHDLRDRHAGGVNPGSRHPGESPAVYGEWLLRNGA